LGVVPDSKTTEQAISPGSPTPVGRQGEAALLLVFSAGKPTFGIVSVDGELEIGRTNPVFGDGSDTRISRRHACITMKGRRLIVRDLDSRNGTRVDGAALRPDAPEITRCLRLGDSLFIPCWSRSRFERFGVRVEEGRVEGPALQQVMATVEKAATADRTLLVTGETGAGKEVVAHRFHALSPAAAGPFVAVNCAAIPDGVAERLLFGARRGAYSGAHADAEGYLQAAHGGTLFLDEVGELDPRVQAKLLRVIETGELVPLGASRARTVDLRLCSATHRDLRALVAAGRLREDLFHRIANPRVVIPPLRERPEEIAWLLQLAIERVSPELEINASLVESCLLKLWPGNVRELLAEARAAAQAALSSGAKRVDASHLDPSAGALFGSAGSGAGSRRPDRSRIEAALAHSRGNVSAAARALGVHRTQLRRWLERIDAEPKADVSAARDAKTPPPADRSRDAEED
jgi:transcriptional regulator of acetoin/glycerol metabolism